MGSLVIVEFKQKRNDTLIANNLDKLLKNRNLNAEQLEILLGIPTATVSRLISGQTIDPHISTLKLITDYLGVSVNSLINNLSDASREIRPNFIPLLDWDSIQKINDIKEIDFKNWRHWQPIPPYENGLLSHDAFALKIRPSMYFRYPQGSIFIFDPNATPADGNIVLVKIKKNNQITVRELIIDPPEWQLQSLVQDVGSLTYSSKEHQIIGINQLIMIYNKS